MNGLMTIVSGQVQRATNEAINEQVLPQLQASLRSVNGEPPQNGWNFPGESPERKSEDYFSLKIRCSSRNNSPQNLNYSDDEERHTA